jgi:hypothetical protein
LVGASLGVRQTQDGRVAATDGAVTLPTPELREQVTLLVQEQAPK